MPASWDDLKRTRLDAMSDAERAEYERAYAAAALAAEPGKRVRAARGALPDEATGTLTVMARRASELSSDPAIVVANPEVEVTAEGFTAWLDRRQSDEPVSVPVRAEDTLAEIRASGEE